MKREQAKQHFQRLRAQQTSTDMSLPELIHLITQGVIGLENIRLFIEQALSRQIPKYNQIYEYLKLPTWRQLEFDELYLILKCLKDYYKRSGILSQSKITSDLDLKEGSSFDSRSVLKQIRRQDQIIHQISKKRQKEFTLNTEQSQQSQYQEKWKQTRYKVLKKLLVVFEYLRKMMLIEGETFEKNRQICEKLDLNMYMRYIKLFQFGFVFRSDKIIRCFKDNALNHLWLDFDGFVNTNFNLVGLKSAHTDKDRYLKLRGLSDILASEKIRKMLNLRGQSALATIVEAHTGTYKRDLVEYLKVKPQQRKVPLQRISREKLKTEQSRSSIEKPQKLIVKKISKAESAKLIPTRPTKSKSIQNSSSAKPRTLKTSAARSQSIYQSLRQFNLKKEEENLRKLVNVEQSEQFLNEYLKRQQQRRHSNSQQKPIHLPPIKF